MDICALKTAIVDCCNSEDFTLEKIEVLLLKFKTVKSSNSFLSVCDLAARSCGVSVERLLSKSRKHNIALSRRIVFSYYHSKGLILRDIGDLFKKNHVTIMHGIRVLQTDIECNHEPTIEAVKKFSKLIKEYENYTIKTDGFNS